MMAVAAPTSSRRLICVVLLALAIGPNLRRAFGLRLQTEGGDDDRGVGAPGEEEDKFGESTLSGRRKIATWLQATMEPPPWGAGDFEFTKVPAGEAKRVAVMASGTLLRYFLSSSVHGLLKPLVQQGHSVDYFVGLTANSFRSWDKDGKSFVPEAPEFHESDLSSAKSLISREVPRSGAYLREVIVEKDQQLSSLEMEFVDDGDWNGQNYAGKEARRSAAKMYKMMKRLSGSLKQEEARSGKYDLVIQIVDDALWLKPFDLARLPPAPASPHGWNILCSKPWSTYAANSSEYTNYVWILDREAAEAWLTQSDVLLENRGYWSLHNLEAFARNFSVDYGISMKHVPPALLPMQRGGHRKKADGTLEICLHKVCDSDAWGFADLLHPLEFYPRCE